MKIFNSLKILYLALPSLVFAQTTNNIQNEPISAFVTSPGSGSSDYVFALNIPSNSDDIYFHLSGPAAYSWIAVGTGSRMKNSLMFLAYLNATGNGVTLSPRLSTGENEPSYSSTLNVETLPGTQLINGTISVNARCTNCTKWNSGSLDLTSTSQDFIYALGPDSSALVPLRSNSLSANTERHSVYGYFTMDMTKATGGSNGTSLLSTTASSFTTSSGATQNGHPDSDSNWPVIIHAGVLSFVFLILMPGGAIFLRIIPASVRWHWVNQTLATILAGIGGVAGIYLSTMYNRSKGFSSPHQLLGLLCVLAVLVQWSLGAWHHYQYKKYQRATKFGLVHLHLGRVILVLAIFVGTIGLGWSSIKPAISIAYAIFGGVVVAVVLVLSIWKRHFFSRSTIPFMPAAGGGGAAASKRLNSEEASMEDLRDPFSNRYEYRGNEETPLENLPYNSNRYDNHHRGNDATTMDNSPYNSNRYEYRGHDESTENLTYSYNHEARY